MLLHTGRPRAAALAAREVVLRMGVEPVPGAPGEREVQGDAVGLWALADLVAGIAAALSEAPATPDPPGWWTAADLARPQVGAWRDFFRGPGAPGLRKWLAQAAPYRDDIRRTLAEEGVPPDLWVLAILESGLDMEARSSSNAVGPWQLVPGTARYLGLLINADRDQRRDWEAATRAACRYLCELKNDLGSGLLALAAFNCGPSRVLRQVAARDDDEFWDLDLPAETRNYVPRALALAQIVEADDPGSGNPLDYDLVSLPHPVGVADLARAAGTDVAALRELNPAWLRDVTPADGHPVRARIPRGTAEAVAAALRNGGLPAVHPQAHRVVRGETLWGISHRYGVSLNALLRANGLTRRSVLRPGQRLRIPG